jgi:hypothetical protein
MNYLRQWDEETYWKVDPMIQRFASAPLPESNCGGRHYFRKVELGNGRVVWLCDSCGATQ